MDINEKCFYTLDSIPIKNDKEDIYKFFIEETPNIILHKIKTEYRRPDFNEVYENSSLCRRYIL